jgi:hypothetical protein
LNDPFSASSFDVAFVIVSSAAGVVDNLDPEWFIRGAAVRASAFNATLLAPATEYAVFVRARNAAGHSNWTSPPTVLRTADALPCPGGGAAGPCSGHGVCHTYKGTCDCAAGYCGLGCGAADGMQIVLDVAADEEVAEYSRAALVAALAQPSVLNVSAQRLAVTREERSERSAASLLSAFELVRVSLTLRFVDRSATPSASDSVETVSKVRCLINFVCYVRILLFAHLLLFARVCLCVCPAVRRAEPDGEERRDGGGRRPPPRRAARRAHCAAAHVRRAAPAARARRRGCVHDNVQLVGDGGGGCVGHRARAVARRRTRA